MKAISLWEPWATFIRLKFKKNETRPWYTHYRGDLLICAAKAGLSKHDLNDYMRFFEDCFKKFHLGIPLEISDLHFGQAVAVVELVDCVKTDGFAITALESYMGNYAPDRYAWKFDNIRPIEPFPVKGKQGFFDVDFNL